MRLKNYSLSIDGHIIWCGSSDQGGYGWVHVEGRWAKTHRLTWELFYGPIPRGSQVLHFCHTPPCIEPTHLYLGDRSANMQDRISAGNNPQSNKTHCNKGHPYDEENTYTAPSGSRNCRACRRAAVKRYYWRGTKDKITGMQITPLPAPSAP